jgi:hypothetical protein
VKGVARLLDLPVLPLEGPLGVVPDAEVDGDLLVVLGIEDDVVLLPVLGLLHAQVLVLERPAPADGLDLRVARVVLRPDLHRDVVAAVLGQREGVVEPRDLGVVLHRGDAVGDLDGLVLEPELRRERDGRIGDDVGQAALHLEEGVLDRQPLGEVGVVPQHGVGVADVEERRDELDAQVRGDLLGAVEVLEVLLLHVAQLGELGVRHEDLRVAGLRGAAPELLGDLEVLVDVEVDLVVEVQLRRGGLVLADGREAREEQKRNEKQVSHGGSPPGLMCPRDPASVAAYCFSTT